MEGEDLIVVSAQEECDVCKSSPHLAPRSSIAMAISTGTIGGNNLPTFKLMITRTVGGAGGSAIMA
jgi:hypothetical protein